MNEFQRRLLDIVQFTYPLGQFGDPSREIVGIDNYAYSCDWHGNPGTGLTFTAPKQFDLVMDSDSDFVMTYISGGACSEFSAVGQFKVKFNAAIMAQITDRSTGRTYFNLPTPLPLIAGMNGFPFLLTSPRVIRPRTTLRVDLTCPAADAARRYPSGFFTLHGAKIYYK